MSARVEEPDTQNHPVWNLYNEWRTARLNVKCIESEMAGLKRWNRFIEISLAIASTSSIGGIWFLQNVVGSLLWKMVGSLAVILTVLKPILKLNEKIRKKQEELVGYQTLDHEFSGIAMEVRNRERYDDELRKEFTKAYKRKGELIKKYHGEPLNLKCRQKFEEEVMRELPHDSFHIPPQ